MEEKDIKDLSFEEALARLENLVRELESGRISLTTPLPLTNAP